MLGFYPNKENERLENPVTKDSNVENVKQNLQVNMSSIPKKQFNNSSSTLRTPSLLVMDRRSVNSPITELSNNFTELAANESSCDNTPKRRLSLTSSTGSPTPDIIRQHSVLTSSCKSTSSDVSNNSLELPGPLFKTVDSLEKHAGNGRKSFMSGSFRRHHSAHFGGASNEASPQLPMPVNPKSEKTPPSALAVRQQQPTFYVEGDETSADSCDSGIERGGKLTFGMPPERMQQTNELSPTQSMSALKGGHVTNSPDLHDNAAQDSCDSPLLAHRLCSLSADEEHDDGFDELECLEFGLIQQMQSDGQAVPSVIAKMLTGKMVTKGSPPSSLAPPNRYALNNSSFKGTLFRSPSMPQQLGAQGYDIRRRAICGNKRSEPPNDHTPVAVLKRRKGMLYSGNTLPVPCKLQNSLTSATGLSRCRSMVESSVSFQRSKSETEGETGDGRKCCLPLVQGKQTDLNNISHDTMARILNKEYDDKLASYTIIDCRYPYEYTGGHIKGAENIYTKEDLFRKYITDFNPGEHNMANDKRNILIFHCEFSSERAPRLSRFLRNHDREINSEYYPSLYHPELYLLEGGYKQFFEHCKELCEPVSYKPMHHPEHSEDLKRFRAESKSWVGGEKRGLRTGLRR